MVGESITASLIPVLVIMTAVLGAVLGSWIFALLRIKDPRAQGYALGVTSHGIGTARRCNSESSRVPSRLWPWG